MAVSILVEDCGFFDGNVLIFVFVIGVDSGNVFVFVIVFFEEEEDDESDEEMILVYIFNFI